MIKELFLFLIILNSFAGLSFAQSFVKTADILKRSDNNSNAGRLNIIQDQAIDTLIGRYIIANQKTKEKYSYYGINGFRIQIYDGSDRKESDDAYQDFVDKFPDIIAYQLFAEPRSYKIRVGDFRSKTEAIKLYLMISNVFSDAYMVPDFINFPELDTK